MELLEDRWVPSGMPTVDLTSAGAIGGVNGVIFRQMDTQPAGSGVLNSFVRLKAPGHSTIEQGYNTDARPLQFDENNSPQFTRALQLSDVPVVNIGDTAYREFSLDINQNSSSPLLSLDELRFFVGATGDLSGYDTSTHTLAGQAPVYDLGANHWIELNARLSHGSGQSDMVVYVPSNLFGVSNSYVYLYSKFGANGGANGGYEEWAVGTSALTSGNTASLSGFVFNDLNRDRTFGSSDTGLAGVTITLTLTDTLGNTSTFTTITDSSGFFQFTNLLSGTYSLSVGTNTGFNSESASVGTDNSITDGAIRGANQISDINLNTGDFAVNYDFGEISTVPPPSRV